MDPNESRCTYGPLKGELWREIYQFELWRNYPEIYSPDPRYALMLGPAANIQASASRSAFLRTASTTRQPDTLRTAPGAVSAYESAAGSSGLPITPPAIIMATFSSAAWHASYRDPQAGDAAAISRARAAHTLAPMSSIAQVAFAPTLQPGFVRPTYARSPSDAPSGSSGVSLAAAPPPPTAAAATSSSVTSSSSSRSASPPIIPAPASFANALIGAWSSPGASSSRARVAPSPESETDEPKESCLFFPDDYYNFDSSSIESGDYDFIPPEEEPEEEDEATAIAKARAGKAPARSPSPSPSLGPDPHAGPIYQAPEGPNSALVQNMVRPPSPAFARTISPWTVPDNVAHSGYREATEQERMAAYRRRYPGINNSPYMPAEIPRNLGSRVDRVAEMRAAQSLQREVDRRRRVREETEARKFAKGNMRARVVEWEEDEDEDENGDEAMGEEDDGDDEYYANAPAWFKGSM